MQLCKTNVHVVVLVLTRLSYPLLTWLYLLICSSAERSSSDSLSLQTRKVPSTLSTGHQEPGGGGRGGVSQGTQYGTA